MGINLTYIISNGNIYKTRTLVSGLGQLNKPSKQVFEGSSDFKGTSFHSAEWDHSCDLKGKKVGVIGTGPSAVGFIPKIANEVKELIIFLIFFSESRPEYLSSCLSTKFFFFLFLFFC